MTDIEILPGTQATQAPAQMEPSETDDQADDGTAASRDPSQRQAPIPREMVFRALI